MNRGYWLIVLSFSACMSPPCADVESCTRGCTSGDCTEAPTAPPCPLASAGEVVLNEVLADPGGADSNGDGVASNTDDEFVEVISVTERPVSLGGARIAVDGHPRFSFDDRCLDPGQALVVYGGGASVPSWAAATGLVSPTRLSLTNSGSVVTLESLVGVLDSATIDSVEPGRSTTRSPDGSGAFLPHPWLPAPTGADAPIGLSPGRCVTGLSFPSCDDRGTRRGAVTSLASCAAAGYGEVVINEVLANPGGVDANGDGSPDARTDEFVELMLVSDSPRRLDAVALRVGEQTRSELWTPCLPAGATIVIFSGGIPVLNPWYTGPALVADRPLGLTNAGATVSLWHDEERLDELEYGPPPVATSLARFPDGVGEFVLHDGLPFGLQMSPGACTNGGPSRIDCAVR